MPGLHDLSCVVHLHSTHSDGTGTVREIARDGERAGVDVVLLTDHDNLDAARFGEEGWYGSTLLLAGHEVSPPVRNHMLAFGVERRSTGRACRRAGSPTRCATRAGSGSRRTPSPRHRSRSGWLSSLGRSMLWEDLDCVDGIEVWSFVSDGGQNVEGWRDALQMITRPERYVTHPPRHNLDEWDRLAATRRVVGIGGLDAHQFGVRVLGRALRLMSYHRSFQPAAHARAGGGAAERASSSTTVRWYSRRCARGAASSARTRWRPGAGSASRGMMWKWVARPRSTGRSCACSFHGRRRCGCWRTARRWRARTGTSLSHRAERPGVYRVEAYLETFGQRRTWLLSNPVYLR